MLSAEDAETVDANAAVIYPIMLNDHLEVIVSIAGQSLKHYSTPVAADDLQKTVHEVLRTVTSPFAAQLPTTTEHLQQMYKWMLAEALEAMENFKPETLVFVADGPLRTMIRSGIRSAVAGLWSLNDQATAVFMEEFYSALAQPEITKAEAFRQAQLALLQDPKFQSPHYWSPFVLVGN